jgi:RNA polymerase sigma-70 factor (ECF subfamily)
MDLLARGDLGALDRLYEQYGAMAYAIAYRITGDRAAAEDVVQDAFLGAWRNAARYVESRGSVRTWLLSIVHHRAIDAIRRRRPTVELPDGEVGLPDALTLPDTWADVELRLDRAAVLQAMTTISDVQREAIELAYFGGLTQTEIAERTGVPLGTVKGRMRLGLQGLRAALVPLGEDPGRG